MWDVTFSIFIFLRGVGVEEWKREREKGREEERKGLGVEGYSGVKGRLD